MRAAPLKIKINKIIILRFMNKSLKKSSKKIILLI